MTRCRHKQRGGNLRNDNGRKHDNLSGIRELWQNAGLDANLLAAERRVWPVVALSGENGSERGAESGGVCWPEDWDAEEYAAWSDSVNQAHTLEAPCGGCGRTPQTCVCGPSSMGEGYGEGVRVRQEDATQTERMAWDEEVDAIYAAEEVERYANEADERRHDH